MNEGEEVEIGEVRGGGKGELVHHIVCVSGGNIREDEVGGGGDEDAQEKEEGPGEHCMPSVEMVDAHPPKAELKAPKLVVSAREATWI
ncbi:hypothetical protein B296_00028071 [Ensete ventricosum]|uniref:Uncharacterized protein n=1 Tax=Ensete ventricosum TaxID=4639 RepID=A0A426X208_ENSVE|nr:hypothetical protein B296_00028071 [Ensete ventricosum]